MTKQKSTKRALLLSALSLLMCVSMLIGSTFAWFTDSVTSAGNKIVAGTLDIQLLMDGDVDGTYDDISESTAPIFGAGSIAQNNNAETLWEPGKTQVAYLAIKNNGNLALKYTVGLDVQNVSKDLYEVMEYAIVADADKDAPVTAWNGGNAVTVGTQSVSDSVPLAVGATHYFALVIHMDEDAGNEYQGGEVNFDLTVLATQLTSEFDSFDDQYDKFADYDGEISGAASLKAALTKGGTYKVLNDIAVSESMTVPEGVTVALNLNGKTITGAGLDADGKKVHSLVNNGTLTVIGGTVESVASNGGSAVLNTGVLTLNNVTVVGAPSDTATGTASYAVLTQGESSKLTVVDSTISGRGAIAATAGTKVEVNGGEYQTPAVAWGHAIYASDEGTEVVINDGTFSEGYEMAADNWGMYQIYAGEKAVVTVNGGNFLPWDCANGYDLCTAGEGMIVIRGGTFADNPSSQNKKNYVADGYVVKGNADGTYSVIEGVAVTGQDGLNDAIANGATSFVLAAGNYTLPETTNKTITIFGTADTVIDLSAGTHHAYGMNYLFDGVTVKGADENYKGIYHVESVTYRNCTLTGLQFLYANTVAFENCKFDSTGEEHNIWTYGSKQVSFSECEFTYGDRAVNIYTENGLATVDVTFKKCSFTTSNTASKGAVEINSGSYSSAANVSFTECTVPAYGTMVGISGWDSANGAKATVTVDGENFTATQWAK